MIDFKKELNSSQRRVVMTTEGPVLVIAGAGSGKTRVIEYRVLHLVRQGVAPSAILLLTFTRRAAQEMLSRASRHDARCGHVEGGTFHSFAYSLLRRYGSLLGFKTFSILDEDDSQEALARCAKLLGFYEKEKRFPKKDTLRKIVSMAVNKELPVLDVLEREYPQFIDFAKDIEQVKNEYIRYKIEKTYFDYEDLLTYAKLLLAKHEPLRAELSRKYRYIMVDEYQDTNKLQADITYLLAKDHGNVMVVGDDAQSIYGFRGASHENIMTFPDRFSQCKVIKLESNYRSHQQILDVANAVLKDMKHKFSKHLVSAEKKRGDKPQLLLFRNSYEEAEWLAAKIKEFRNRGIPLYRQAVLFRSAYISIALQVELQKHDIPFQVFGGLKFYETAHVKDLISHVRVIVNPRDEISWMRILMLLEGIGPKTAQRIVDDIMHIPFAKDVVTHVRAASNKNSVKRPLKKLFAVLEKIKPAGKKLEDVFTILIGYYQPILTAKFDDWKERLKDLYALQQIAQRYRSAQDFLADFALDPPERSVTLRPPLGIKDDERPLTLSTIHSAKGLEWECVFLIGLVEGVMPVSFSLNDDEGIEEEHRLFYVGLTRAKEQLFLSVHHENHGVGTNQFNKISRFVDSPAVLSRIEQIVHVEEYEGQF